MSKFKGFSLVRVIRAVTATSPGVDDEITHSYEVEIHDIHGKHTDSKFVRMTELWSDWGKEVTAHTRYAVMQQGEVELLDYNTYQAKLAEWQAIK